MRTEELEKKYPDLIVSKMTLNKIHSSKEIANIMRTIFGNALLSLESSGKKVTVAYSQDYGRFIAQLVPGAKVILTGGEIQMKPEWKDKEWIVSTAPSLMCGKMVCWLEGFSGAYSCEMLKMAEKNE